MICPIRNMGNQKCHGGDCALWDSAGQCCNEVSKRIALQEIATALNGRIKVELAK